MWKSDIEELREGELLGEIIYKNRKVLCEVEEKNEYGDPGSGAGVRRDGPGHEDARVLLVTGRAEERSCENALKEGNGRFWNVDLVLVREVSVERGDLASDDVCGADGNKTAVRERETGLSAKDFFKRATDKER